MKTIISFVGLVLVVGGGAYLYSFFSNPLNEKVPMVATTTPVKIIPISHATAAIEWGDTVIYTDPTGEARAFEGQKPAQIVLVTDIHGDHLSTSTLAAVVGTDATFIVPQAVKDLLPADLASRARVMSNDETIDAQGLKITAVPMYNLAGPSEKFHTKGRGNGYLLERDGVRVYIAGDTAGTPEMRALTNIDIALIPMNLPYTMSIDEAADAVLAFKPRQVYPYHYRGPDGLADVARFKSLVAAGDPSIDVVLANWYPAPTNATE